jgi:putative transposase
MGIHLEKAFYGFKRGPLVLDEEKFRFDMLVILVEEWLRRKLRVRKVVECLR